MNVSEASSRPKSAGGLLLALGMCGVGAWLLLRNGEPASLRAFFPWALGGLLASQGVWLAFRQLRRLLDPEGALVEEQDEAEREEARDRQEVTLPVVFVSWFSAVGALGFLIAYALDDSGEHGERTLGLTAFFAGWAIAALAFAIWATLARRHHRHAQQSHKAGQADR